MLNALDLFSGIGGISRALHGYARTVAYCERNEFCRSVLLARMLSGDLDSAPIWDDVRTLGSQHFGGRVDIVTGGFPCQDISSHGSQRGLAGERSGLFYEVARLVGELRPRLVFLENVSNITKHGLREVSAEISRLRYDCRWLVIPAAAVGAPHPRKRWFMLAHADVHGRGGGLGAGDGGQVRRDGPGDDPAGDPHGTDDEPQPREVRADRPGQRRTAGAGYGGEALQTGEAEPVLVRVADGLPRGLDGPQWWSDERGLPRVLQAATPEDRRRVTALGNSVCPAQARRAFEMLLFGS